MEKEIVILALDIETSGANVIKNGIISIGYCYGDIYGNVMKKGRFSFEMDENMIFEERCMNEFWSKNLKTLELLQNEAKPIKEAITVFANMIDDLDTNYDLRIISDNKDFDLGFINYYFAKYLDRNPINYKYGGNNYRMTYDTDSYSRGVMKMDYKNPWTSDKDIMNKLCFTINCEQTHLPDDDAEYIYKFHIELLKKITTNN